MTEYLFPDNTVLCNFAVVERLDLLRSALDGQGRWTEAVAFEASRSAEALPPLLTVPLEGWLGDPIEVTEPKEIRAIARIRRIVFGGTDDKPLRHLGEAQTCYIIGHWASFAGSWWISDDRASLRYARRQHITARETIDIVRMAVASGEIDAAAALRLMMDMADCDRALRLPRSAEELG